MSPTNAEIELEFYEKFFIERNLEPYPVQEQSIAKIFAGQDVLVTVPTGTGKTLMAKAAIHRALRTNKTAIYTTPLRALTEEKFRELSADFGEDQVGFATGDYKVNPRAPVQVLVAEILWNRIYGDRVHQPADVVVMDEGHYFNDPERGYVWEQSIIGLDPRSQLVILSATIGYPEAFCQWVYVTRRSEMALVRSTDRKVPLYHEFREQYLIEVVKELYASGDYPAIIFGFSRKETFERARILRSCPRFVTDEERLEIDKRAAEALSDRGLGPELKPLLLHGIGIHHAGILPRYRQLVEQLTLERLLKFVVSTETISAGINLPAKRVIFPSLRKYVRGEVRLLRPAEYHQMSGRAGRPQFDTEGIALTLAPEEVVQEFRKEIKDQKRGGMTVDELPIKKRAYMRARTEAQKNRDVTWDADAHLKLVGGQAAALLSQTKITAEQILAIGLPDLTRETLPGQQILSVEAEAKKKADEEAAARAVAKAAASGVPAPPPETARPESEGPERVLADTPPEVHPVEQAGMPVYANLNIRTVIDNLLLPDRDKREAHKRLAMITANLQALGVLDPHGVQVKGEIIGKLRGIDGLFIYYVLMNYQLTQENCRELCEYLIDHDVIQKALDWVDEEKKREWCRHRLRELRRENPLVAWEDVEAEYAEKFPRPLTPIELMHQAFLASVPHQELHHGKTRKNVWAQIDEQQLSFADFVEKHDLAREEGNLFSYLARVMKVARSLHEVTEMSEFRDIEMAVRLRLAAIDERILEESR